MDEFEVIIDLISQSLGTPKKVYESRGQASFNCIECDEGRGKGNLEVSIEKSVYHCWACGISGPLGKLFDSYGNKKQKKLYLLLRPEEEQEKKSKAITVRLPEGYTKFKDSNPIYPPHREAINYLYKRGITDEMIDKYQIGYTVKGDYSGRIIVPSYTLEGKLNYFVARDWGGKNKLKYKNPIAEKDKIIFNEHLIDWNKDIFLVEGVFDAFFLDNSIPMLGKYVSNLLFESIYTKSTGNIIVCLDGDAYNDAKKLYKELNGGQLYNRVKLVKLPLDKDVCDLRGKVDEFYLKTVR